MNGGRSAAIAAGMLTAVLSASAVWAQVPGGGGSPGGRGGQVGSHLPSSVQRDPAPMPVPPGVAEQARTQLGDLEVDLRLSQAQRATWAPYADKVQKLADDVARARNAMRFPKGAAPEQLDFVADTLRNRLTAVEDIVDAGKSFYAVLTPEQKAIADGRLARISIPLIAPSQSTAEAGRPMSRGQGSPDSAPRGR